MFRLSEVSLLIVSVFFFNTCKKETIESDNDKYIIELNKDYTISSVTHFVDKNVVDFERSFEYSDRYVKVYSGGILISTYFLNNDGLADSCNTPRIKYQYNKDNYLISESNSPAPILYEYSNGNRTKFIWGTNSAYFQYNSLLNIIDIDSFHGSYLGKLNKNLRQSSRIVFPMASNGVSITYQYTLNSTGLVIQRIGIKTYNSGLPSTKSITDFEYLVKK
jgi:hypothetical protein